MPDSRRKNRVCRRRKKRLGNHVGLDAGIAYFNVESIPELEVINQLAGEKDKIARVSFRINPDVGAHTHANITTGLAENKFGIAMADMEKVIEIWNQFITQLHVLSDDIQLLFAKKPWFLTSCSHCAVITKQCGETSH